MNSAKAQMEEGMMAGKTRTFVIIAYEDYGVPTRFDSVQDAETALHACGKEFEDITLSVTGDGRILNEVGQQVGRELRGWCLYEEVIDLSPDEEETLCRGTVLRGGAEVHMLACDDPGDTVYGAQTGRGDLIECINPDPADVELLDRCSADVAKPVPDAYTESTVYRLYDWIETDQNA